MGDFEWTKDILTDDGFYHNGIHITKGTILICVGRSTPFYGERYEVINLDIEKDFILSKNLGSTNRLTDYNKGKEYRGKISIVKNTLDSGEVILGY